MSINKPAYISVDNIILPNKSLTNFDLEDAADKLNIPLKGVFCRNMLPRISENKECGILNLDDSSGNGTHWTAWYKSSSEHASGNTASRAGDTKFYFDSYGLQPPIELKNYLTSPIYYNSERVQPNNTVLCGHLCLYVLNQLNQIKNPSIEDYQNIINTLY